MPVRKVYTIGFARRRAAEFFETLKGAGVRRLIDIRLHNWSQLAGYTKREDLPYFLREICDADYIHELLLAPTEELLSASRKRRISWEDYERGFLALMSEREVEKKLSPALFDVPAALLCAEPTADRCHRRLVLEYLGEKWGGLEAVHL